MEERRSEAVAALAGGLLGGRPAGWTARWTAVLGLGQQRGNPGAVRNADSRAAQMESESLPGAELRAWAAEVCRAAPVTPPPSPPPAELPPQGRQLPAAVQLGPHRRPDRGQPQRRLPARAR